MTESTSFLQRLAKGRLGSLAITLDQLAFSAAAFLLQFAGAHSSGNAAFAGFSLVTLIQTGQWYLSRAAASETVLVGRHLQGSGAAVAAQRSMDTALLIGFVGSAVCLGGAALTDGPLRWLFLMQVVASPIAAVFDHSRYLLLASGRAVHAFLLDTLWTLTMLVAVAALLVTGNLTPVAVFLSWGLALVVPTAIGFKLTGVKLPVPGRQLRAWFDQNRKLVPGFLVDAAFLTFGIYVTFAVIWLVTGDENLGLFRKALIPDCVRLDLKQLREIDWLPSTCAYRLRGDGQPLPDWHYLISGDRETVHEAGISVRGWTISEEDAGDLELHLVDRPF